MNQKKEEGEQKPHLEKVWGLLGTERSVKLREGNKEESNTR